MKQILLFLTLLICTSTFAQQREKMKSATEYVKFYDRKVKNYVAYKGATQEDIKKELRNNGVLYEININYFGSIVHRGEILTFKKFIKELPESGKVGFIVTVDRKQEYKKVYFEVLGDIYEYIYDRRRKSGLADDKLDREIPYYVVCIAKGRYDEKIIPEADTASVVEEPMLEESLNEVVVDSVTEVVAPKEEIKIKPKKKKSKEKVTSEQVTADEIKPEESKTNIYIILILAVIVAIVSIIAIVRRRRRQ